MPDTENDLRYARGRYGRVGEKHQDHGCGWQGHIDGDVLQALAMTLALRARTVDAAPESTLTLVNGLVGRAYRAAQTAPGYDASWA